MSRTLLCAVALLALSAAPSVAFAQWRVGGAIGAEHESSWDEFLLVTLEGRGPIAHGTAELAPRLSYFLRDGETRIQVDVNYIKPLVLAKPVAVTPYVGLGAALERLSASGFSDTSPGINYVVGATTNASGSLQWYGQFQYSVLHESSNVAVISVGALFRLGGPAGR